MKSLAQVLVGPNAFELREVGVPDPGPGQVRMRTHACGICGSDKVLARVSAPGTVLGHEVVAEVESCGSGVSGWRSGDRAVPLGDELGMSDKRGGFGEWIVIAASALVRVPESLASLHAVVAEPVGNGLHFVRRGRLQRGQRVAILTYFLGATIQAHLDLIPGAYAHLFAALAFGAVHLPIETMPLADAARAHARIEQQQTVGKVILVP